MLKRAVMRATAARFSSKTLGTKNVSDLTFLAPSKTEPWLETGLALVICLRKLCYCELREFSQRNHLLLLFG